MKPVGSQGQGKRPLGPAESLPGNSVREQDHSLLGEVKYEPNVQICVKCVTYSGVIFTIIMTTII